MLESLLGRMKYHYYKQQLSLIRVIRRLLTTSVGIRAIVPVIVTNSHVLHVSYKDNYGVDEYQFAKNLMEGLEKFPLEWQPLIVIVTRPGFEIESLDELEMSRRGWVRA